MRGEFGERLGEVEVVGELRPRLLLALADLGRQPPPAPHPLAQGADEVGVLGEPLGQDRPGAVQRGLGVGHALLRVRERGRSRQRFGRGVAQQAVRQRLQPRLLGDLRLGAPLRLERQVDVLQPRLGLGRLDRRAQFVGQLALLGDGFEDGGAPLLQLPQVPQPLFEGAQLGVVQHLGRFLAVARDERHRGAAVQQLDGCPHLPLPHAELLGDPALDGPGAGCGHDLRTAFSLRVRRNCGSPPRHTRTPVHRPCHPRDHAGQFTHTCTRSHDVLAGSPPVLVHHADRPLSRRWRRSDL